MIIGVLVHNMFREYRNVTHLLADWGLIYNEFLRFGRVKKFTQCSRILM
jgi:hypothetical protein